MVRLRYDVAAAVRSTSSRSRPKSHGQSRQTVKFKFTVGFSGHGRGSLERQQLEAEAVTVMRSVYDVHVSKEREFFIVHGAEYSIQLS